MAALDELKAELDEYVTLKFISSSLTEVSSAKLQHLRKEFERNQQFFEEISQVYDLVKISAAVEKRKKAGGPEEEGETISVALTSNMRFYGSLNTDTTRGFLQETKDKETKLMIIGQTGIDYARTVGTDRDFEEMVFKKDSPSGEEIEEFLQKLKPYGKVFVYYPKFVTLLSQKVSAVDITHTPEKKKVEKEPGIRHIFEPEISKMVEFFERQVRTILFDRVMLETDLSRTAARLMAMSAAEEKAEDMIREKKSQLVQTRRSIQNRQLLETFAGIQKWE